MSDSDSDFGEAIRSGDVRRALEALRDRLASEMVAVTGQRGVAALAKQLLDTLKAIQRLPVPSSGRSLEDELRERRAARGDGVTARGEPRAQRFGGRETERHRRRSGDPKKS
jgi:hypothetical protein